MTGSRYAAALSEHPLPTHAVGEVIGEVLEQVGEAPDLAVLFVTGSLTGVVEDLAATVRTLLRPGTLLGATAVSVLSGDREVEEHPAVVLWAGRPGAVTPVRIETTRTDDGWRVDGLPPAAHDGPRTLLLLADPFSFPTDVFLDRLRADHPELTIVGGLASAARGPGGNRLVLDAGVHLDGAVGVLFAAGQVLTPVVSQGCRPIGVPLVVTRAEGNIIHELAGRPALERLQEVVTDLAEDDRRLLQQGVHLGRVVDENQVEFRRGDFLIRNVIGADRANGAVAVGDPVEVGATVQFQVRDAASADEDLRLLLADRTASGALVFTCNGRGVNLFGEPDHDARMVDAHVEGGVAGMFCAGELGPIGGHSFLHGFTASIVLFEDG
ncbi:FIST N-terminal domain-containing protein [soil metagenome]